MVIPRIGKEQNPLLVLFVNLLEYFEICKNKNKIKKKISLTFGKIKKRA